MDDRRADVSMTCGSMADGEVALRVESGLSMNAAPVRMRDVEWV